MKKECAYARRRVSRYHAGYLFLLQRRRIERHLAECAVCRSEYDAARRIDETQSLLRSITPEEGLAGRIAAGTQWIAALRRLLYRPVWLLLIVAAAAAAYLYVINPLLHDPDLERLDAPVPTAAAPHTPAAAAPHAQTAPTVTAPSEAKRPVQSASTATAPAPSPLVITITVEKEKEKASIRRINEAMKEHAVLRTLRFGESTREISGNLTAGELYTFFNRIDGTGKVTYKRSRLAAAGENEIVPFVMKLQMISSPSRPAGAPQDQPVEKRAERPAEAQEAPPADGGSVPKTTEGQ